jgi:dUTP pyrophosphatase
MNIFVKKLHPDAIIPRYATDGAAAFDLHSVEDRQAGPKGWSPATVSTGLAFEIPADHVMLVFSRSGHGFKNGVRLANSVGVIDSDYRGPVMVRLHNDGPEWFDIDKGDRIAQAIIMPIVRADLIEVSELSDTNRGDGGFGSTGNA